MFKVLLVDDEPMALEALRIGADWEEYGFLICGECGNGEKALKLIGELHPDLIITDIRMPVMDGLELVKRVKANPDFNDPMFIIVSGYDEFKYAKSAMQYGIQHYLLKPIFKDEFLEVLLKIIPELKKSNEYKKICCKGSEVDIGILFDMYLNETINMDRLIENLDVEIVSGKTLWSYAFLDVRRGGATIEASPMVDSQELRNFEGLKKAIEDIQIKEFYVYPIFIDCSSYRLVMASTGQKSPIELASYLIPGLSELFKGEFYLAIGNPVQELSLLSNSMKEAEKALEYSFFSPSENILYYRNLKNWTINYDFNGIKDMEELLSVFESLDQNNLIKSINSSFNMFRSSFIAPEIIEIYLTNVIFKSFSIISNMGGVIDEIPEIPNISKLLNMGLSINQIEKLIEQYAIDFCIYAHSLKHKDIKSDKQKVEEYIQQNFKRNLTIKEIARKLYIHPTYLGCQINKWFGCSYKEYLHKLRMEEAKRIVTETELRVHEIAYSLGYSSYNNFLKQFVKYFSIKPTEYRNKLKL